MGYNIAALKVVGMQMAERSIKGFVDENWEAEIGRCELRGRKRGFVDVLKWEVYRWEGG